MSTVSEVAWSPADKVDFCACCGLRRPLGRVNLNFGPDQELVRCIDCFFNPSDDRPLFLGEATFIGQSDKVLFGQTGDVILGSFSEGGWSFEPHGDFSNSIPVTENDLANFNRFQPKRYSELSPSDVGFEHE